MGVDLSSFRGRSDPVVVAASLEHPEVFAVIFHRHFDAVHVFLARRIGGSRADDLASVTFTVAFERRRAFRADVDSARPWLFGIASNVLRNEWRADERTTDALARVARDATDRPGEDAGAVGPGAGDLRVALRRLDVDQREVLLLVAWEGLSYDEIAAALGIPVGTVRSRLARARERLRIVLADTQFSPADVGRDGREVGG